VLRRSRPGATVAGDLTRVRQVEREEFLQAAAAVHAVARRRRPGQVDRDARWWNRILGGDGYAPSDDLPDNWLLHDGGGGPDGLLAWKASGPPSLIPPLSTATVWSLATATDEAYRDLWCYLSGIDGVDEVTVGNRPVDEPVRWLLGDGRTLVTREQVDFLWLRLLDVPVALAARGYRAPGEVVLEVLDSHADGFASGRYRLSVDRAGAECERTDRPADLVITAQALASIYLGGFRLGQLNVSGAASERTPGALSRVDLMFSTPIAPWNGTWF
jgi:predicted acetyltransferase